MPINQFSQALRCYRALRLAGRMFGHFRFREAPRRSRDTSDVPSNPAWMPLRNVSRGSHRLVCRCRTPVASRMYLTPRSSRLYLTCRLTAMTPGCLSTTFAALAHPTGRTVLARLAFGEVSVTITICANCKPRGKNRAATNAGNDASTIQAAREIVSTRVFDAPRALVFKLWSDPKQRVLWLGPSGVHKPDLRLGGARVGGAWRIVMPAPMALNVHPGVGIARSWSPSGSFSPISLRIRRSILSSTGSQPSPSTSTAARRNSLANARCPCVCPCSRIPCSGGGLDAKLGTPCRRTGEILKRLPIAG